MDDISTQESEEFQNLLNWLSEDREQAGAEYIKICEGLVRFFRFKGCSDTQTLADETIDRVKKRVHTFDESNDVKKITIIYGFANNVAFEHLRKKKKEREAFQSPELRDELFKPYQEENEPRLKCMDICLDELSGEDREIFLKYYVHEENAKKSVARRKLAGDLGIEMNALGVRVFRLRGVLAKCIKKCVKKSL